MPEKEARCQFPVGWGMVSWSHHKANPIHFISLFLNRFCGVQVFLFRSGSSFSSSATSSKGNLSSHQALSIKSEVLPSLFTSPPTLLSCDFSG